VRAVVQCVREARVEVDGRVVGAIGPGLLVLVGVGRDDSDADVRCLASKLATLRLFPGEGPDARPMDRSVEEVRGALLVVSQFTLYGSVRRGRRPSFDQAAPPEQARERYEDLVRQLREAGLTVATGQFQAQMDVHLVNAGPITILLDSASTA
jgi:D-tyrosyl-tRNA(Tyr) deacylase